MAFTLADSDAKAYQRDGAVCLRALFSEKELACLRAGIDANLRQPSPRAKVASRADDPGLFIEDFCCWRENINYRQFIFDSQLGKVGAFLMRSASARLFHDHMLTKEAGTRQPTPWHQDQPYYNVEGRQNCSFWIPVDPVERESTLEFVAGSHLGPWLMPRSFLDSQARWFPEGSLADRPDIEANRDRYNIVGWALQPGDAVCFHMLTLHATKGSKNRRRVFSVRLLGDDMVYAPRAWKTSPDFSELKNELGPGAALNHPMFPLLYGG